MNRLAEMDSMEDVEWRVAAGTCGLDIERGPVEAAYVNGVALFAYQPDPGQRWYSCVITGQYAAGGTNLADVKAEGMSEARNWGTLGASLRMTRDEFDALVADQVRPVPQRI